MPTFPFTRRELALAAAGLAAPALAVAATGPRPIPELPAGNAFATRGAPPQASRATHTTRTLRAAPVTEADFAPFGQVLAPAGRRRLPINTYGDRMDLYREGFASDQPTEWFIFSGRPRGTEVLFLERHQQLGQTFIPVGGKGFVTVLARPGAREADGMPALEELHAFWVPGEVAIQLHRGTWHENPMPVADDTRLLVTSHANLTLAHQQDPDPRLKELPLDLERRWYRQAGYSLTVVR